MIMEIPSSSNANCFDFALYDYLQSRHISSSTSTSCFDLALDILAELEKAPVYGCDFENLKKNVRLMKTCFLYVKKCRRNHEALLEHDREDRYNIMSENLRRSIICFRIQDVAIRLIQELQHSRCGSYFQYILGYRLDFANIRSVITRSKEKITLFLETDLRKSCAAIFIDYYSPRDPRLVMDLIMCLLENLNWVLRAWELRDTIRNRLKLLRNLIGFVTMQGFECSQLTELLTYTVVAAGRLISICLFDYDEQVANRMESEIYRLIHEKFNLLDLQVRETFVHVLTASKKQARSSHDLALQKNEDPVVGQFIGSLRDYLMDLLGSYASFQVPVKDQILKLHEEIRCLDILLKQEEKLGDEIKDLIGVMVSDVGILTFSLSVNEIKEGLPEETNLGVFHLHKVLKYMAAEVAHNYPLKSPYSSFNYPRSNELGCMDFFLENLKELARCDEADDSIGFQQDRIQMIQKDLVFLRSFLENIKEQCYQKGKLQAFWSDVMEAAYKAELLIDLALVGDKCEDSLDAVSRDINLLKIKAPEIHNGQTQRVNKTSIHMPSQFTVAMHDEDLVGLDDEVETITHRLTRGSKQLDVVPIVGMPGLGKTTLANKVYTAPSVRSHFHVRGWCCVSQTYSIRSVLVELLCSIRSKSPDEYLKKDENDLAMKLRQVLLRNRYLLVLDDLWDVEAWNLLEKSLPNDANGSRILFTSRQQDLSLPNSEPHCLRNLTDEEGWTLLQRKLFVTEDCPPALSEVGSQIAKLCRGLPLTVVLVAGILATTTRDSWGEVVKSLSSSVLGNEYCKKTLELSYSHLPDYLKPCLLYFAAFQEDEVISVRRLLRLWISEGFVQQAEGKSLQEAAYDYLMALINRSLVMVIGQRIVGGAKACLLHDLVHEFCVEKAEEESFLNVIYSWKAPPSLTGPSNPHRVCVLNTRELKIWELMLIFPNLRSLILFGEDDFKHEVEDLGILLPKLLRVLDFGNLRFGYSFPTEVVLLVHLRYLALKRVTYIPSAIANLSRLETLIVEDPVFGIELPWTIWNIKTLSHLRTIRFSVWPQGFIFPVENLEVSPDLGRLDTLDLTVDPSPQSLQKILRKLPSIRRLKCMERWDRSREATRNWNEILEFDGLSQLESLHLIHFHGCGFKFPLNLKKLALSYNRQPWSEISTIGKLPNLEVLKLLDDCFVGEEWVMKEGEFPKLRVLKLSELEFRNWTAFSDNFSRLEKLVLHRCEELEKVPSCLGECETLEMIEVKKCRESVVDSVEQIQQEQMDMGNEVLKIKIDNFFL